MRSAPSARLLGVGVLALLAAFSGCGGAGGGGACPTESWRGRCHLTGVAKIREADFPAPLVVLEAIYAPERQASSPSYTPPDQRREFRVPAREEYGLRQHLEAHPALECWLEPPPAGTCQPGKVVVQVPEYRGGAASEESGPRGCAKLESGGLGGPANGTPDAHYADPFLFQTDATALDGEESSRAETVARKAGADSTVECFAVVGQHTAGESPSLAHERARTLRRLLVASGVPEDRIMTLTQSARALGPGARAPEPDPKERRAYLRVMLRRTSP